MKEAVSISETSLNFYETTRLSGQKTVVFISSWKIVFPCYLLEIDAMDTCEQSKQANSLNPLQYVDVHVQW
jgi:hypothetical protein